MERCYRSTQINVLFGKRETFVTKDARAWSASIRLNYYCLLCTLHQRFLFLLCTKSHMHHSSWTSLLAFLLLYCLGCKSTPGSGQPGGLARVRGAFHEGICTSRWPWDNERGWEGELSAGERGGSTQLGAQRSEAGGGPPQLPQSPTH